MTQGNQLKTLTLKLWHGGCFRRGENGLVFMGSTFRTVGIDPDEMCWFTLVEEAEKCGFRREVDAIFFMSPKDGLKRAIGDSDALLIGKMAVDERVSECYIVPECDVTELMQLIECGDGLTLMKMPAKMIPRRKGSSCIKGPPLSSPSATIDTPPLFNTKSTSPSQTSNNKSRISSQPNTKKTPPTSQLSTSKTTITTKPSTLNPTTTSKPSSNKSTTTLKPKKASTQTVLRSSPRLNSEPDIIVHSSIPPPSTEPDINVHELPPETSYNCNELTLADLFNEYEANADLACVNATESSEDEVEDPGYNSNFDSEDYETESDVELDDEAEVVNEALNEGDLDDLSDVDDELKEARVRLKQFNADALKVVEQLQLEAAAGKLSGQEKIKESSTTTEHPNQQLSDYDESGDEEITPGNSDEESIPGKRVQARVPVVNCRTDFNKLRWCVGISFPTREVFRECVTRYAIAQGRDLTFDVSDTTHGRKLGVRCKGGRVIVSGRGGGRGRGRGRARGDGRGGGRGGGRSRPPQGFGVLIDQEGNAFTNPVGSTSGPTSILVNGQGGPNTQETVNQIV